MKAPVQVQVLPTHSLALQAEAVRRAAERLRAGEAVALPTETVYGLAANALDPAAVARVFAIKGRPATNPLIVHVSSVAMARTCVSAWPAVAEVLARAFWPGPLTLVLPRTSIIPDIVTGGGNTVAVRWPAHPVMQAVIRACGFPLAAPSANLSNQVSPTTARHVAQGLGGRVPLILDGGHCDVGIESTVVDLSGESVTVLRPGMITAEAVARVAAGFKGSPPTSGDGLVARSPGLMPRHYAPLARLEVWSWAHTEALLARLAQVGWRPDEVVVVCHEQIPSNEAGFRRVSVIPHDAVAYARALYAELHHSDEVGARAVIVETPPGGNEWEAVHDRLRRAATE